MDTPAITSSLFDLDPIDQDDELDLELSRYYNQYCNDTRDKSERELHNYLQEKASRSKADYMEIVSALLYGVLTDPESAQKLFQSISLVNRDQYTMLWNRLIPLITTIKFTNLKQRTKDQIIWLYNELTNLNVSNLEGLYLCLLRQIKGGDFTGPNIRLCDQLLKLLETHRSWLDSYPNVLTFAVYTYLRLIPEHRHIQLATLQQREIRFVVSMLRQKWNLCAVIGRDLIRGLHDVYHLPDFGSLWSDLLDQPHKISPNCQGISNVLKTPTPREFLRSRLTPDMEHKLLYILQHLPIGQYQRNLGWFTQRFLYNSDAEPLYADIIRFIVAGWYPSNQILQSDIVPRYVVIGNMIRGIKSPMVAANVKTALIYDWLFFTPNDNIMFIEPAMLLMERSVERYPLITSSLLEFINHSVNEYYKPMNDYMISGIKNGMQAMLSKTVIRSLVPIYRCHSIDNNTRNIMQLLFGEIEALPLTKTTSATGSDDISNAPTDDNLKIAPNTEIMQDMDDDDVTMEAPAKAAPSEHEDDNRLQTNDFPTDAAIQPFEASTTNDISISKLSQHEISNEDHDSGSDYTDSDNDDDKENADSSDTAMQSSQSYWIFGDALNRFKTACSALLMDQSDMEDEESSVQFIIAKRSLKEILAVFLRMQKRWHQVLRNQ
ncbi:protein-domain-containing protein [Absidia repens]|uniref:Protein-domain-containing protein n=1 Tax=Absidia repens TaxID=90262 RepID=A0A1X2IYW8_9FUNG|nr:protein-domain-containing protein [Absidia repens]